MTDEEFYAGFRDVTTPEQKARNKAANDKLVRQLGGFTREQMGRAVRLAMDPEARHLRSFDALSRDEEAEAIIDEVSE